MVERKKRPVLRRGALRCHYFLAYQVLVPWHPGEQELAVALKFKEATRSIVPLACVAVFTVVELYPAPWQVLHANPIELTWKACWPVAGGMVWQEPHTGVGGT